LNYSKIAERAAAPAPWKQMPGGTNQNYPRDEPFLPTRTVALGHAAAGQKSPGRESEGPQDTDAKDFRKSDFEGWTGVAQGCQKVDSRGQNCCEWRNRPPYRPVGGPRAGPDHS
jgi:hypothetical protein